MTTDQKEIQKTVGIILGGSIIAIMVAFIWLGVKVKDLNSQLAKGTKVEVERVQPKEPNPNPLGIGDDVLITIAGVITNATPDEVAAAHDLIVKTVSGKLGTNGLKCIYVEFR